MRRLATDSRADMLFHRECDDARECKAEIQHLTRPIWRMLWVVVALIVITALSLRAAYVHGEGVRRAEIAHTRG